MAPRIAIIYYSTYGHIEKLAVAQQKGIEKAGGSATIFQQVSNIKQAEIFLTIPNRIAETLPEEVLKKMYAPPKADYPIITPEELLKFDGFLFGI
jgi:hypothetical protein